MIELPVLVVFLALTYFTGTWVERKHFASIEDHESTLKPVPFINENEITALGPIRKLEFTSGCVVIGADFFSL